MDVEAITTVESVEDATQSRPTLNEIALNMIDAAHNDLEHKWVEQCEKSRKVKNANPYSYGHANGMVRAYEDALRKLKLMRENLQMLEGYDDGR